MTMTKFSRINKQREEITMRVLEDMEKGGNEWKKPWVEASPLPPHNPVSGTQYSGRNFLYTYVYGMMRGYADPRWATEKQIKEMGWKIPENLQNGRGGINDELGVGIEHWGMYAYIPRVKKDGTPLTDKGGTQKFTRVRAVKENGVWGRYRKGDNGKYEFEQLPSGVHPHPECDRYFKVFNLSLIEGVPPLPVPDLAPNDDIEVGLLADDYIDLADGAKQHFELPRTAREYKPSDFSPKFPISNVKFEVDESVKDLSTSCRAVSSSTRMNSTMPSSGTRRITRNHLRIFSSPARATSRPPVNSMEQSKSGRRASTAPSWKSAMSKTVPFRNMRTIGFCRSTTIKSCWRPLKIISDAERVITGRQAT